METIYRILGKRGRTTIPYILRITMGFHPNDLVSFRRDGDTIVVKREKVCDNCCAGGDKELPVTSDALKEFLSSLPSNVQKEALVHLTQGLCNENS
ncbi:MAG: AbrB/MazE/SpoVT family DNA-binding domain-containing protein [Ruminococcaceae bacterium]|nr:AbrB/MazE/SpoVT family DNA-binding domain-containing protein [Oscillospiraceae bacterium]